MKQFNAAEFISNEETPVTTRGAGESVEIVTVKGRGLQPVLGYMMGAGDTLLAWGLDGSYFKYKHACDTDLFFVEKNEVVHIFQGKITGHRIASISKVDTKVRLENTIDYEYLGTVTGPLVPPPAKDSEVAK